MSSENDDHAHAAIDSIPKPNSFKLLLSLPKLRDDTLGFLQNAVNQYGDLIRYKIGPLNAFVLSNPADIQHVLQDNNRNYSKDTFQYNGLSKVTGRGLLTSDGDLWFKQRRRMQPAFHRQRINDFGKFMTDAAVKRVNDWQDGEIIDIDQQMMELALEILGKALLGVDLRTEAPQLTSAVLTALDHVVNSFKSPDILPSFIISPHRKKFKEAVHKLDQAVHEIIQNHRQQFEGSVDAKSLLDVMLYSEDDHGQTMSDQQVRDELITILIAGHETVASALTWSCYLLASNPQAEERLKQELIQVLDGRSPTVEDLPALDFTKRVFDEALRLYPPAWIVTRKAIEDDVIGGLNVPAGSLIIVSLTNAHTHPAFWDDPASFNPVRFLPENSK
ncbi:MAG TPA: cytochrome P450, partial [Anaerolineaceae bacterium]|nr:cytochrome P450 [Anaerolineaceae bacterium]